MDANLKDARELSGKLEEKADDLFESKLGEPELQVHRTFKIGDDEACRIGFAKNQDVNSVQEIKTLVEQVRISPLKNQHQSTDRIAILEYSKVYGS